ncbi:hypothetical protein B0H16DRAFT_1462025 [Mycena metata]|uniref:Uncharacterized protein n=1 Tax=Mycena metata TaxID=1033252 RepID=A0AAD7IRY8_9AGAR|nr:hypothetical protein B0H16DRAFT_1462025 [Mycena metata]
MPKHPWTPGVRMSEWGPRDVRGVINDWTQIEQIHLEEGAKGRTSGTTCSEKTAVLDLLGGAPSRTGEPRCMPRTAGSRIERVIQVDVQKPNDNVTVEVPEARDRRERSTWRFATLATFSDLVTPSVRLTEWYWNSESQETSPEVYEERVKRTKR